MVLGGRDNESLHSQSLELSWEVALCLPISSHTPRLPCTTNTFVSVVAFLAEVLCWSNNVGVDLAMYNNKS